MLRAIAAAKKKNDRIDASKIADCLRCDFLPECHMASTEIRDRRRTLRYRALLVRQMVQMKNRVSGLLMETGVSHNKQRLHKVGYFRELLSTNEEVHESIRPLLKLSRETIERLQKTEYALVSSLRARSAAGGEAQTAQNGSRSGSDHGADLGAGDRRCLALPLDQAGHQLLRTVRRREELSRQGDAHADFQAAQQAYPACAGGSRQAGAQTEPRTGPDLREGEAERKRQSRDAGRGQEDGRLSARRRTRTTGLRACRRVRSTRGGLKPPPERKNNRITQRAGCQVLQIGRLGEGDQTPEAPYELFRDWQRTQTQSSVTALRSLRQQMDVWFCREAGTTAERHTCELWILT